MPLSNLYLLFFIKKQIKAWPFLDGKWELLKRHTWENTGFRVLQTLRNFYPGSKILTNFAIYLSPRILNIAIILVSSLTKKEGHYRAQQIRTTYRCTPTNLLCTPNFWKPYKVLYTNIYFYFLSFALTLLSSLVENYFVFYNKLLTWIPRQCLIVSLRFL